MARSRDSDGVPVRDALDFHDYGDSPPLRRGKEEGPQHKPLKPGLATAAAILWLIWGIGGTVAFIAGVSDLLTSATRVGLVAVVLLLTVLLGTLLCLVAGVRTLSGAGASTGTHGLLSLIFGGVILTGYTLLLSYAASEAETTFGRSVSFQAVVTTCGVVLALLSGLFVAGVFGMAVNAKYVTWWRATRGKKQGRQRYG